MCRANRRYVRKSEFIDMVSLVSDRRLVHFFIYTQGEAMRMAEGLWCSEIDFAKQTSGRT